MFADYATVGEEQYDDIVVDEMSYGDREVSDEITGDAIDFADGIFGIFQDIVDREDSSISEEFTSQSNALYHFTRHCMGNKKKSRRSNVHYDFTKLEDYLNHEDKVSKLSVSARESKNLLIEDLTETDNVVKLFCKFFGGGKTLVLGLNCGFSNKNGPVRICLHSWATSFTTNYSQNTVDFIIQAPDDKTITIYPIDANYLEAKINNEIKKNPSISNLVLKINH